MGQNRPMSWWWLFEVSTSNVKSAAASGPLADLPVTQPPTSHSETDDIPVRDRPENAAVPPGGNPAGTGPTAVPAAESAQSLFNMPHDPNVSQRADASGDAVLVPESTTEFPGTGEPVAGYHKTGEALSLEQRRSRIEGLVSAAAELLPVTGPITAFAFLDPLQALEDLPYEQGVLRGAKLFGCEPYLNESRYREKLLRGRITAADLSQVLQDDLGEAADQMIAGLATQKSIREAMLLTPICGGTPEELRWFIAETDALERLRPDAPNGMREKFLEDTRRWIMRDLRDETWATADESGRPRQHGAPIVADLIQQHGPQNLNGWNDETWEAVAMQSLWRICKHGVHSVPQSSESVRHDVRHRDLLLAITRDDTDLYFQEMLVRFCAAYADQGFAGWQLPGRDRGLYSAFLHAYGQPFGPPDLWCRGLTAEVQRLAATGTTAVDCVYESLVELGVPAHDWDEFLTATTVALRGWASLLHHIEVRGDRVPLAAAVGTGVDFLAVRLLLERFAIRHVAAERLEYRGPLCDLRTVLRHRLRHSQLPTVEQRAFVVFQVAQVMGWTPGRLYRLSHPEWVELVQAIEGFGSLSRRRVFHLAFERFFRRQALDALSIQTSMTAPVAKRPRFQAVFCIDAREESFRRHLEELAGDVQTFGAAGFFGVAMYYRGVADAYFTALCPIVIKPQHWVTEEVVYSLDESHRRRARTRRALGTAAHQVYVGSRGFAGGALITASLGVLASIPLVARVLFPRLTARVRRQAGRFVAAPTMTRLRLERKGAKPGPEGDQIGYTVDEMAVVAEKMLRDIGLVRDFSRLVIFVGHGSFCLNNPHKSAYDCGACSGGAGGPNARALATMLNDTRVREILWRHGIAIPVETVFMSALHNTAYDTVTFYDLDQVPLGHVDDFEAAKRTLDETCARNAHERCRRFYSAPLDMPVSGALSHVESRAEDLAQTRPEFGNATNAMCFVGRRDRIRGLFLDRRSFLHSYDPTGDNSSSDILARILSAVVPVCAGINLTYLFSYIDSAGWGSGTKLPHNVTALLGVMDGFSSDLRLGLPLQGVEIHEPVRLLLVVESTPAAMQSIMNANPVVGRILKNGWMQLAVLDPRSNQIQLFNAGKFEPYVPEAQSLPQSTSSFQWYRGWREHLGFARIVPESTAANGASAANRAGASGGPSAGADRSQRSANQ